MARALTAALGWGASLWVAILPATASVLAPVVEGRDVVTGIPVRIAPEAGRPLVVVFLSARCPCSAGHEQSLKDLAQAHPKFRFVGVHSNSDEPSSMVSEHFGKSSLPFPVVRDEGFRLADRWGALKTPHVFVVDGRGEILFQGGVDDSKRPSSAKSHYLADALTAIQAGRMPEAREVRTLGCVIKR